MRILLFVILFIGAKCFAQDYKVSGYVNSTLGEVLPYASCFNSKTNKVIYANEEGFFMIPCEEGSVDLRFSFSGYEACMWSLSLTSDTLINIYLKETQIEEVVILEKAEPLHLQNMMGKYKFKIDELKASASFSASTDIFKAITQIPGISGGKEGYSNFYVRGGDKDENIVLIDNAPVYGLTASGGFFSLYNPDMISEIYIYKEGFPARFGGRNSSVVDIRLKEGNYKNFSGDVSVGVPNANIYLNVPLYKDRTVLTVGGRSCYLTPFFYPSKLKFEQTVKDFEDGIEPKSIFSQYYSYGFSDFSSKLSHKFSDQLKLQVSSIFSTESNTSNWLSRTTNHHSIGKTKVNTGNSLVVVNLLNVMKSAGFWKLTASYAATKNNIDDGVKDVNHGVYFSDNSEAETKVERYDLKFLMEDQIGQWQHIKWGGSFAQESFKPIDYVSSSQDNEGIAVDTSFSMGNIHSHHLFNGFVDDQIQIANKVNIYPGLRVTAYRNSKDYSFYFDPRFSIRYQINDHTSVKSAYTITHQYSEQLSMRDTGVEWNTWVGIGDGKPCRTQQFAAGIFGMFSLLDMEYGLEGFYKKSTNRIYYFVDYQDDIADFLEWENNLKKGGIGEAYGVEMTLKGQYEKFSWQANYVLGWNYMTFSGVNNGNRFASLYDKRHELSLTGVFKLNGKNLFSSMFLFHSGAPVTLPEGYAQSNSLMGNNWGGYYLFSSINNYRMPAYHRLDLSYTHKWLSKKNKRKWYLKTNIYNAYNHSNPYKLLINGGKIYKVSNFTILPSINVGMEF